ncbi:hypothetical protein V5799_019319 [Amblyomma americanum]|uniref:Uncharacterized protein n=1 Tax=Amblyomma americanum TaxID=6943 RepID=A0AAQ4EWQ5_AMBAM
MVGTATGVSESVNEANDFIDVVLLQRMPSLVKDTPDLYPSAPLHPFNFKASGTALSGTLARSFLPAVYCFYEVHFLDEA